MIYVIQVTSGQEAVTVKLIEEILHIGGDDSPIKDCFYPQRERRVKYEGSWKDVIERLFPGYLFLESDRIDEAERLLRSIPRLTKMLGIDDGTIYPLSKAEENMIYMLCGKEHIARLSNVEITEGSRVNILDGPLKNYEGQIVKINLHKRVALVRVHFMREDMNIYLGIEILGKKNEE